MATAEHAIRSTEVLPGGRRLARLRGRVVAATCAAVVACVAWTAATG